MSYYEIRKEFYKKYRTKLVPLLTMFEKERKQRLLCAILSVILLVTIGIAIILHAPDKDSREAGAFAIALAIVAWSKIKKSFENKIKYKIMPAVCNCFGNIKWSQGTYNKDDIFIDSNLIPSWTSAYYDDIFNGSFKDVKFEIVEARYTVGYGKNRRTIFDGVIVKLDMNKSFNGNTVIIPDSIMHISPSSRLRHTVLEDPVFEKKFDVFTDDEVEARYLITPSFMERLKNMKTAFFADQVRCAFYRNKILIALNTNRDLFSLCSLTEPIASEQQYFQLYEEITSILKLIDHFKLDQKIGL